jgi:hypothetical protein
MVKPNARPRLSTVELHARLAPFGIDRSKFPVVIVGYRGYYKNSMGVPGKNDIGIYDDAVFIDSPNITAAFNANTDPSVLRPGMATVKSNMVFYAHTIDYHRGKNLPYLAVCQRAGSVRVIRAGNPPYEDEGRGCNIHRGGYQTTGSEGCTTVYPDQWDSFISAVVDQAKRYFGGKWKTSIIPYVILED